MNLVSGRTVSYWEESVKVPEFPALVSDARTDVCIVGAGISGLTTAFLLAREGRQVIVIDDGPVGGGETGRTSAHLSNAMDDRFYQLEKWHGEEGARLAAESHGAAIDKIEEISAAEGIHCDFRRVDGYLFDLGQADSANLQRELEAAQRAGLRVELAGRAPVPFNTGRALRFPRQGQFHPMKYLAGLAEAVRRRGGAIHTGTAAEEITGGKEAVVRTKGGQIIRAGAVVVAANTPVNDWVVMHTKQAAYRTYVVGIAVPHGSLEPILLWDDLEFYHYVRLQPIENPGEDLLIVGGEDHKTGQAEDFGAPFGRLEKWTRDRYSMAGEVRFRWSGQVMEPVDGMGFIGRNPRDDDNVYIITGDSGQGLTHGTIGGILITDLIHGRPNSWAKLYDPSRKSLRAAADFAKENLNVAVQYTDYVSGGEVKSAEEIRPGMGALIRSGVSKLAVYRDESGTVHEMSAVCPHLQCIVQWNNVEKSWDCPCHGSRFDRLGRVLNGPANSGLKRAGAEND